MVSHVSKNYFLSFLRSSLLSEEFLSTVISFMSRADDKMVLVQIETTNASQHSHSRVSKHAAKQLVDEFKFANKWS